MAEKIASSSVKETHQLAEKILKEIKGNLICLYGPLGSGKTTFVQGLARALGIKERVISPSFVLVRQYEIKNHEPSTINHQSLTHIDCYRLRSAEDIKSVDLEEFWSNKKNLVVIEWAEKVKKILPKKRMDIYFRIKGESKREIMVNGQ